MAETPTSPSDSTHPPKHLNFHDARASIVQSAIRHMLHHHEGPKTGFWAHHPLMRRAVDALHPLVAHRRGTQPMTGTAPADVEHPKSQKKECIHLLVNYLEARLAGDEDLLSALRDEFRFSHCDPGWLETVEQYLLNYRLEHREPDYRQEEDDTKLVFELPRPGQTPGTEDRQDLVIGLLSDWGTGEDVALVVLDRLMDHRPDVILHLGDVYYSGTPDEMRRYALEPFQAARKRYGYDVPIFNLPGNHDYYAGGEGFYRLIDQLNAGLPQGPQGASYFSLVNDHWQIQGLDTSYHDHDYFEVEGSVTRLRQAEADWHRRKIEEGIAAGRKIILTSHHQYFSAYKTLGSEPMGRPAGANYNPNLAEVFGEYIDAGHVAAWFWGHEHVLSLYRPYQGLARGRCVGHGAFPVFAYEKPYEAIHPDVPVDDSVRLGISGDVYDHGYAVLRLDGARATVDYYSLPGIATRETPGEVQRMATESF